MRATMPISVVCGCGVRYKVPDHLAGTSKPCKKCGELVHCPMPGSIKPYIETTSLLVNEVPAVLVREEIAEVVADAIKANRKKIGPFALGSFGFAMLALSVCWVPFLGLAAFPLAFIGIILAIAGLALAFLGGRHSLMWPASTCAMFLLAMSMSYGVWLAMLGFVDRATRIGDRIEAAADRIASKPIVVKVEQAKDVQQVTTTQAQIAP